MGVAPVLRQAAALLLTRKDKVWLAKRGQARFLPGFWVFPGGAVEGNESHLQAALRETFEETGLKLDDTDRLKPFARAITPKFSRVRFDARVFRCELADNEEPRPDGRELKEGRWLNLSELWSLYRSGDLQLAPPTFRQLKSYTACFQGEHSWPTPQEAFEQPLESHEDVLPMAAGVSVIPLRSPALPPAAWTNAVLVGERDFYLVDPGGVEPQTLLKEIARRNRLGHNPLGVILSHHHLDHLAGYEALNCQHIPLFCHPLTEALLPTNFPKPVHLEDGDVLRLAQDFHLVAHFTPGHAPGHLCLQIPERKTLLAADLVSSLSSIVIPSDNGDLSDYLGSLLRMKQLNCHLIIPSHGPAFGQDSDPFGQSLAHREYRERQILNALKRTSAPLTVEKLTKLVYQSLDARLESAAQSNVLQHLRKLEKENHIHHHQNAWTIQT